MERPLGLGWIRRAHRDAASLLATCAGAAWSAGPRRPARSGSPGRRRAIMPDRGSPPVSTPATRPDTTRLQRLAHSYRAVAALMAAVELGLFTRVARGADTEAAVAQALDLAPTNAERLVTACVALGLLVRQGDRLPNAPHPARLLFQAD